MSTRGFMCDDVPAAAYRMLLDTGFRRSGRVFYQPVCRGCRACVPMRVVVNRFAPTRSQRRAAKRNSDLVVSEHAPAPTDEKYDLYRRYLAHRHDGQQSDSYGDFVSFLCDSPTRTVEFQYRDGQGDLLGVGICDLMPGAVSTAYFYFDPDAHRRSIGVFSVLHEIDFARRNRCDYYYLGYWIAGSETMDYKSRYQPCEALCTDGVWRELKNDECRSTND